MPLHVVLDKSRDCSPNLSFGDDVEYKAGFRDRFDCICWGTVLRGTNILYGVARCIDLEDGMIREGHFHNDDAHGY